MIDARRLAPIALALLVFGACAPSRPSASQDPAPAAAVKPSRVLNVSIRTEPPSLAQKVLSSGVGTSFAFT